MIYLLRLSSSLQRHLQRRIFLLANGRTDRQNDRQTETITQNPPICAFIQRAGRIFKITEHCASRSLEGLLMSPYDPYLVRYPGDDLHAFSVRFHSSELVDSGDSRVFLLTITVFPIYPRPKPFKKLALPPRGLFQHRSQPITPPNSFPIPSQTSPSPPSRAPRRPQPMRIPFNELQIHRHIPLALRPILLSIPAISLQIRHLNPLASVPEMLQFDHWTPIGAEARWRSGRGVVRAVGAV